ncbi:MAG TPA: cytochrome c [Candidatus Acidoferrum sp.]|nr:cytochrome c [Candidatus Acidoferrum sp.]
MTLSHSSRSRMAGRNSRVFLLSICGAALFSGLSSARQQPALQSTTPQATPSEQVQKGQSLFATQCAFCHGRDAAGGETGPDLTSSELVEKDVSGNEIGPVVRSGRIDKGMPPFNLADAELGAVVAFIHDQKTKMDSKQGRRRTVQAEDLQTGNAEEGKRYFNGSGGCAKCHSPSGDLAGVASRFRGLALLERTLYPWGRRAGPSSLPVTATVTLPSGETVMGKLAYRDEFVIALVDSSGWYRSWFKSNVKFKVNNPLEAHSEQLGKYTEETMHNVLAYLQTLR